MSRDKTLKSASSLARHRNVLSRAERIDIMKEDGRWSDESSPIGLPKVAHRKAKVGGKVKKEKTEDAAATPAAGAAAPAADKKPAK